VNQENTIELNEVTKLFAGRPAVNGVTFRARSGDILGLVGPNGSGKTTVLGMIAGLIRPTSGSVRVLGLEPFRSPRRVRTLLGMVPQESALYEDLTAQQNLEFHWALYASSPHGAKEAINDALNLVELEGRRNSPARTFSGGMKRRLALARALLHRPKVLLFDEPTLGVDVHGSHAIWDRIEEIASSGCTVLVTTNVMSEADRLCRRVLVLDGGRVVAQGTPDELKSAVGRDTVEIEFAGRVPDPEILSPLVEKAYVQGRSMTCHLHGAESKLGTMVERLAGHEIAQIHMRSPSLDDVFLHHTGRKLRD